MQRNLNSFKHRRNSGVSKDRFTLLRYSGVIHNSKLTGDNYGNKFLHLVNSDDCGDSIFLDFDRKMGKEKRYETTIPQKLIERTFEAKED